MFEKIVNDRPWRDELLDSIKQSREGVERLLLAMERESDPVEKAWLLHRAVYLSIDADLDQALFAAFEGLKDRFHESI